MFLSPDLISAFPVAACDCDGWKRVDTVELRNQYLLDLFRSVNVCSY